jgi:hypothetical protein
MELRLPAGLGSASFDSFPVKELWADSVSTPLWLVKEVTPTVEAVWAV